MGQPTKLQIEEQKKQKRETKGQRRALAKGRSVNIRHERVYYLIVCEGEKTEPNYFKSLIADNNGSEVISEETSKVIGGGRSTMSLVKFAKEERERLEKHRNIKFDRVWIVFDKDDFTDFNQAIELCNSNNYEAGWTNVSFELWYFLHFEFLDTAITRKDYIDKINNFVRKKIKDNKFSYEKKDKTFYVLLQKIGNEAKAIERAKKLVKRFKNCTPEESNPCTMIHLLVEELRDPEKILNEINNDNVSLKTAK